MSKAYLYNEENISQKPAIEVLKNLGYIYLPPEEAEKIRGNPYNVLLTDILRDKLKIEAQKSTLEPLNATSRMPSSA